MNFTLCYIYGKGCPVYFQTLWSLHFRCTVSFWCFDLLLSVCLMIMCLYSVNMTIILLWRQRTSRSVDSFSFSCQVPQTGLIYKEIADIRPHTDPNTGTKTVYATAQLPTNPSDPIKTVYASPQLPTNHSDSSNTVYTTV